MIEPTHLRIGNIISWELGTGQIVVGEAHAIDKDKVAISDAYYTIEDGERVGGQGWIQIEGLFPVPLTPEWLERMGFEHIENILEDFYAIEYDEGVCTFGIDKYHEDWFITGYSNTHGAIKYVHQLQNLYFALTSQELTIAK